MSALRVEDRLTGGTDPAPHHPSYPPLLQVYGLDRKTQVSARALKQALEDLWGYASDVAAAFALFESCQSQAMAANLQRPSKLIAARAAAFSLRNFRRALADVAVLAGDIAAWRDLVDLALLAALDDELTVHCTRTLAGVEAPAKPRMRPSRSKYLANVSPAREAATGWPAATFRDGFTDETYVMSIDGEPTVFALSAATVALLADLASRCFGAFATVSSPYP